MKRKPVALAQLLKQVFRGAGRQRRRPLLGVEQLCDRVVPAVWNVTVANDEFDANPENDLSDLSLREAIYLANQSSDATQTINLVGGTTYTLTIANTAGQENATAEGDLDIVDQGNVPGQKSYLITSDGTGATIDQTVLDRVFQILASIPTTDPADVTVEFRNVTITGGTAIDDGTAGSTGGTTALGGGVLNQGGDVTFTDSIVEDNAAEGSDGVDGSDGTSVGLAGGSGSAGQDAYGGGIYSSAGAVTLTNTAVINNRATAGNGGEGGEGGTSAAGGAGGAGGSAAGAGVFVLTGDVTIDAGSSVSTNTATAGDGGAGGNGGGGNTGGNGGAGGVGGDAHGGGVYAGSGTVTIGLTSAAHVDNNYASGGAGGNGGRGANGSNRGGAGGAGGAAGVSAGGGVYVVTGNVVVDNGSTVSDNLASADSGGNGGFGGAGLSSGGNGGAGGAGGDAYGGGVYVSTGSVTVGGGSDVTGNTAYGTRGGGGGFGGNGDIGGAGGDGGRGGDGTGGGIYVATGDVTIEDTSSVNSNGAYGYIAGLGGRGGAGSAQGGAGGVGGVGGNGQGGGVYVNAGFVTVLSSSTVNGNIAQGGSGEVGGDGGAAAGVFGIGGAGGRGGNGGTGAGGGLYVAMGNVNVLNESSVNSNAASGGLGGENKGPGALGGAGGAAALGYGGNGGDGGDGGDAYGGGIYVGIGEVTIDNTSSVNSNGLNTATSSGATYGGDGGNGGDGGAGRYGGNAGNGGGGGNAYGGGVFINQGNVLVDGGSAVNGNSALGGSGSFGGNGGNGNSGGGDGGRGGRGGSVYGGGIYAGNGLVRIDVGSTVNGNLAIGNNGSDGGNGGSAGSDSNGRPLAPGFGGSGGNGGSAQGGGIWIGAGEVIVDNSAAVNTNIASGSLGGDGGNGRLGGAGGNGGHGQGGGIFAAGADVTIDGGAEVSFNHAEGEEGGNGGDNLGGGSSPALEPSGGSGGNNNGGTNHGGAGGNGQGGGIYSAGGTVTLTGPNVRIFFNDVSADNGGNGGAGTSSGTGGAGGDGGNAQGGGIYIASGTLTADQVNIQSNLADATYAHGGNGGSGNVSGNGGAGGSAQGGGLYVADGTVTLRNSSVVTNSALNGASGGTGDTPGDAGNAQGGGVYVAGGTVVISNSTLANNTASGAAGDSQGGAVFNAATLDLRNSTIAFNTSADEGGGVRNEGTLTLVSTLIGDNTSDNTTESDLSDPSGTATASYSLIEAAAGHSITNGTNNNIVGKDASLGTLVAASNGNGTFVIHLLPISYARNAGANPDALATDQEGAPRTLGRQTDIGAVEEVPVVISVVSNGNGSVRIVDVNTGTLYQAFRPFDGTSAQYRGIVSVAMGDVNNDGFADIIVATRGQRNGRVKVYDGRLALTPGVVFSDPNTTPNPLITVATPFDGYIGGLTVGSGDVDGDGFDDIVVGSVAQGTDLNGNGTLETNEITTRARFVVLSGANPTVRLGNITAPFGFTPAAIYVAAGDMTGDGKAEVMVSTSINTSSVKVYQLTGATYTQFGATVNAFGSQVLNTHNGSGQIIALDVDGDGLSEFAVSILNNDGVRLRVFDASLTQVAAIAVNSSRTHYGVGKVNADDAGADQFMLGRLPETADQVQIRNSLTGAFEDGFDAFPSLVDGIALAGV